ncbi:MAG: alpha/beta hydrolase [Bacteroidales bacterium]
MHEYQILEKGKPLNQAKKAIILLHGRGGSANNIITLADEFCDEQFYIAAPQATNHSWYPYSFLAPENQNEPWLSSAVEVVKKLIDETAVVIGTENVYLMGFSQGACLTLEVSSQFATKYAGVVAFTGGLIGESVNQAKYQGNFEGTNVFIGNSDTDPHVPVERSEESKVIMENIGAQVILKIYPGMSHTINQDEILTVRKEIFQIA